MRRWICVPLLLVAAGCTPDYPMDRQGTWHVEGIGANDANLHAMIVNPRDLVAGVGETRTVGPEAAAPVRRLLTGKRTALPASNVLQLNVAGTPPAPAAGGDNVGQ